MASLPQKLNLVTDGDPSEGEEYDYTVRYDDISYVEIFPPVGISRFGDSEKEYFLAPEVPGRTDPPAGIINFRDSDQKIRRQAVRFRVYAYKTDGTVCEINNKVKYDNDNYYSLQWTVHVANKKAANTTFHGRHASPPVTALRNPNVQANLELDKRTNLIVDSEEQEFPPDDQSEFVNLRGQFQGSRTVKTDVYLGQLQADNAGRLIFVPGTGHAKSVLDPNNTQPETVSEFDNTDWIDTACDGWVKVEVTADAGDNKISQHYAAVVSGPPNFAWGINAPTTLYNIMEDIYWRQWIPALPVEVEYDFSKDIWPVLNSAASASWTNDTVLQGHGPSSNGHFSSDAVIKILKDSDATKRNGLKTRIFERLRKPDYEDPSQADARFMPRLSGDDGDMPDPGKFPSRLQPDIKSFAALTKLQYERFRTWKDDGQALPDTWSPEPKETKLEDVNRENSDKKDQPDCLTRAILESTIGDPLFPGIEMYWIAKSSSVYDFGASTLEPPFRVNHGDPTQSPGPNYDQPIKPGHLTRGLSLPWQSDFMLCETHWWPSNRPDNVVPKAVYDSIMGASGTPEQFDTATRMRSLWTRGFRTTLDLGQTRTTTDLPWFANTDMVRFWNYLGIVRKHKKTYSKGEVTAYVESERLEL